MAVSFFLFISIPLTLTLTLTISTDVDLLLTTIKPSLNTNPNNNIILTTWNTSTPLCQWKGLKWVYTNQTPLQCTNISSPHYSNLSLSKDNNIHLFSIQLPSANLSGTLPKQLADFTSLQSLYLSFNSISGRIPVELGYSVSLSDIDLGHNLLSGSVPVSIWNLCDRLVSIRVHGNLLSGSIPEPGVMNISCDSLIYFDFGENKFTGGFPEFVTGFKNVREVDVSGNNLVGELPKELGGLSLNKLNVSYNNFSGVLPDFGGLKFGVELFEGNGELCGPPLKRCRGSSGGLGSGAVAGVVIGLMTGIVVLASVLIGYSQRKKKNRDEEDDVFEDGEEDENGADGGGDGKLIIFQGGEHLTLEDVLNATGQVMEKTNYGTTYKAKLADGGTIALRLLREGSCKEDGLWLPSVKQLGRIRHESLVPLRAFYEGKRGEKLLIYDYLPNNKTLHELLHEARPGKPVLNWARRHKIALAIAKGLAHLHSNTEAPITHGNMRSRNVLVDDFFVARLTDCGLYKLMIPAVADEILAAAKADGYKAPGKTGTRDGFVDLPAVVKVAVLEETTMEVFDVEILKGIRSPMEDGLVQALKLAMGCCAPVAAVRPSMEEVVKQLEENRPRNRSALYSPAEPRSGIDTPF